jgi:ribonuclease VapC
MFVDTSAFVAIFCAEPEAVRLAYQIQSAARCFTSSLVRLETCMVVSTRLKRTPAEIQADFDAFLHEAKITVVAIDDDTGQLAVEAFQRYGKGRGSSAQLNLADCMSYACAREHGVPILFKGRDFSHTDLPIAS